MSWALSCLQYRALYGNVNLVTDKEGKSLLMELLRLPYTSVSTALEDFMPFHSDLWMQSKMYVYSIQDEPFLHVDGDAFSWSRLSPAILKSDIVVLNEERSLLTTKLYQTAWNEITSSFGYVPEYFEWTKENQQHIVAYNAGVIGGNNVCAFKNYVGEVKSFLSNNFHSLPKIKDIGILGCFAEQHLLYVYSKFHKIPVTSILPCELLAESIQGAGLWQHIRDYPVFHPVSHFKQSQIVCDIIENTLKTAYPEYYYRILKLLNDHTI